MLLSSPVLSQLSPGGDISPAELEQMLDRQNEEIVQFYTDAINWAIESADRYWSYFATMVLVVVLFKK